MKNLKEKFDKSFDTLAGKFPYIGKIGDDMYDLGDGCIVNEKGCIEFNKEIDRRSKMLKIDSSGGKFVFKGK